MAGKIVADIIESAGSQISLNVGNVTILTASSTGLTLIPTTNVNVNLTNSIVNLTSGNVTNPSLTFSGNTSTGIYMPAANTIAFTTAGTEDMRITSTGILDIGGSSGGSVGELLVVEGANSSGHRAARINNTGTTNGYSTLWMGASNDGLIRGGSTAGSLTDQLLLLTSGAIPISFYTNNTERMRIDSSGNLLVNGTSQISGERFSVNSGSNVLVAWLQQGTNTSGYNGMVIGLGSNGNNTSSSFLRGNTNTVGNWYLFGNGTTSFTSDQRLKKNIETTRNGYLEDLSKLRVVKYNWWKDDDNTPKEIGLIAQEVEQVFPGLVKDDDNPVSDNDDTVYKTLKQSVLPFMLLKAIQELKAIVDAQAVEIAALKAK